VPDDKKLTHRRLAQKKETDMDWLARDFPGLTYETVREAGYAAPGTFARDGVVPVNTEQDNIGQDNIGPDIAAQDIPGRPVTRRGNVVMVLEDGPGLSGQVGAICGYVGLSVEAVSSVVDLGMLLDERRPLALIAPFETDHQDGGHILKSVAMHDRDLPVMLLTGRNPIYLGAAEAMQEILKLNAVCLPQGEPTLGEMVEFLARAAQRNRRRRPDTPGLAAAAE
jgi:hypothetical protein